MSWLVLFDIDGTLLLGHDPLYVTANRGALEEVYGTLADLPDVPGDTASAYTRHMMRAAGLDDEEIEAGLERWCERFSELYVEALENAGTVRWNRAPGAKDAIAGIEHRALLTGNPEPVARARMQRLGLDGFFPAGQGAFGCEHEERVELFGPARDARRRLARRANCRCGRHADRRLVIACGGLPLCRGDDRPLRREPISARRTSSSPASTSCPPRSTSSRGIMRRDD